MPTAEDVPNLSTIILRGGAHASPMLHAFLARVRGMLSSVSVLEMKEGEYKPLLRALKGAKLRLLELEVDPYAHVDRFWIVKPLPKELLYSLARLLVIRPPLFEKDLHAH